MAETRQQIAAAIVRLNETNTIGQMIDILKNNRESRDVRMDAAWTLGELGNPNARMALLEALANNDTMLQMKAGEALADLGRQG